MKRLLLFGSTWPEPASSAAGSRTLQILDLFLEDGWQVTFLTSAGKRPHSTPLPETVRQQQIKLNSSALEPLLKEIHPDLVWFDRFMLEEQFGWRVTECCPQAKRIVDTIDLHSLRELRRKALHENREVDIQDWFSDLALRELAAIYRSDLSLLISDEEHRILTRDLQIPESLLHVIPFLCNPDDQTAWTSTPGFQQRNHFVTLGNFRHPPNADSVRYLAEQLWPKIRPACPEAELHVYGADLTPALRNLHAPERGFHMKGRADQAVATLSRYRVLLAPIRYGAGLKGKLLDAMLAGTPSITTPIGAEGMQGPHSWPGDVCDSESDFIHQACALYSNETDWNSARHHITPLLNTRFDWNTHAYAFRTRIDTLMSTKPNQAADQLPGALLRHHHHRSTEYMSRWIELKNQTKDPTPSD